MMAADDVIDVLDQLAGAGVCVWLDGGWGVDTLLGRQTRVHEDLHLVVDRQDLGHAEEALATLGFRHIADAQPGLPARLVLQDGAGGQVDLHPVVFDAVGNGHQELGGGRADMQALAQHAGLTLPPPYSAERA